MATVRHRYVNTGSTSGGNGTTSATTGANRAYATLSAALAAEVGNLVTQDVQLTIHCINGGAVDTGLIGSMSASWVTDATRYLVIQADSADRHQGVWDETKYCIKNASIRTFANVPNYTRIFGLQIMNRADDNSMRFIDFDNAGDNAHFAYNICRFEQKARSFGSSAWAVYGGVDETSNENYVYNNLVYDTYLNLNKGVQGIGGDNTNMVVYNNTIIGPAYNGGTDTSSKGIKDGFARVLAKNNLVYGWAVASSATRTGTTANATDQTGFTGGSGNRLSQTFTFVNSAGGNFQLASTDAGAKGFGGTLSADATLAFPDDITSATRSAPWDIGAFKAQSSAVTGTASGSLALGGAGTGAVRVQATATGRVSLSGASTGVAPDRAAATGQLSLRGAAAAAVGVTATASGTLPLAGIAACVVPLAAQAVGALSLGGNATAAVLVAAQAAGVLVVGGTATSTIRGTGAASGSLSLAGTAVADVLVAAQAAGVLAIGADAAAQAPVQGAAAGALSLYGASAGQIIEHLAGLRVTVTAHPRYAATATAAARYAVSVASHPRYAATVAAGARYTVSVTARPRYAITVTQLQ